MTFTQTYVTFIKDNPSGCSVFLNSVDHFQADFYFHFHILTAILNGVRLGFVHMRQLNLSVDKMENKKHSKNADTSLSLSAFPFNLWGLFFTFVVVFLLHLFIIFGVGLAAYLSNHNLLSREHIFVGFNEFPSLVYWCTVIHHHRPQRPTLFVE